jgi:pimeloyl-ACP methyl ester carboxylesterase
MSLSEFRTNGLRLAVSEFGEGPPVLFQHGLCGDAQQPVEIFPVESSHRCMTLECRGHGGSDAGPLDRLSIATFTDDIAAFLDARKLGPLLVGGTSMGAAVTLRLAVRRPDLVRGLVLARPAWTTQAAPANMRPNILVGELLERYSAVEARLLFEASDVAAQLARDAPDNLATMRGLFDRTPQAVTAALLTRISIDGPGVSEDEIRALKIPALVIGHGRDSIHPLEHARTLAALLPHARFVEITPKAENRARYRADFRAALQAFFTEQDP